MNDDSKIVFSVAFSIGIIIVVMASSATLPGIISDHQRYSTYLEAQRIIIECRIAAKGSNYDALCGPIPPPILFQKEE